MSTVKGIRKYLTEQDWQQAKRLWRAGYDTHDIARYLNVTEAAVYKGMYLLRGQSA